MNAKQATEKTALELTLERSAAWQKAIDLAHAIREEFPALLPMVTHWYPINEEVPFIDVRLVNRPVEKWYTAEYRFTVYNIETARSIVGVTRGLV